MAVLLAWYHGHKGENRISSGELSLLCVLLVIGAGLLWAFTRPTAHALVQTQPATPVAPAASVAVLPFANLTGEADKEYFSDGMAEELINELTDVPGLKVPARTSSFAYRGRNVDIRQIARDLGVATILEGSVRSAGERIRVTAQLINAQTGYHLWSKTYDEDFGNVFKLEDEVSAEIVQALKSSLNAQLPAAVAQAPPTQDPDAYRLYLQGSAANPVLAIPFLNQAIAKDPRFARAYAARAEDSVAGASEGMFSYASVLTDAERDANTALALDPSLAPAQAVLGTLNVWRGDWVAAESSSDRARQLDRKDPQAYMAHAEIVLAGAGHMRQAEQEALVGYGLAPANPRVVAGVAALYDLMGRTAEAMRYARLTIALGEGDNPLVLVVRRDSALRSGRYEEAARLEIGADPTLQDPSRAAALRQAFAAFGNPAARAAAARALRGLLQALRASKRDDYRISAMLWPTRLGDVDFAYDSANWYLDQYARDGIVGTSWGFLWMPEMRPFRQDPRFQAFVRRLKLIDYWTRYGPPDDCDLKDEKLTCR